MSLLKPSDMNKNIFYAQPSLAILIPVLSLLQSLPLVLILLKGEYLPVPPTFLAFIGPGSEFRKCLPVAYM